MQIDLQTHGNMLQHPRWEIDVKSHVTVCAERGNNARKNILFFLSNGNNRLNRTQCKRGQIYIYIANVS